MIRYCPSCHAPEGAPHGPSCALVTQSPLIPLTAKDVTQPPFWPPPRTGEDVQLLREISAKLDRIIDLLGESQ